MQSGHYQISAATPSGSKIGTALNYHPNAFQGNSKRKGLDWRTNLYYLETSDLGQTWQTVQGKALTLPLKDP